MGNLLQAVGQNLLSISIKKMLLGAGLGLVSYAGISTMLEAYIASAVTSMQSGDAVALAMLGLSGMDTALSLVLSGAIARATMATSSVMLART